MDTKRHLFFILAGFLFILPLLNTGCKKGEDDPFFSIYTRKARVTGEWIVQDMESDLLLSRSDSDVVLRTITKIIGQDVWEQTVRVVNSEQVDEFKGEVKKYSYTFDRNGSMSSFYNYEFVVSEEDPNTMITTVVTTDIRIEITGSWNFMGGIDAYNNKERLAITLEEKKTVTTISTLELTEDFDDDIIPVPIITQDVRAFRWENGEMSTLFTLRMLKNKDMIMEQSLNTFEIYRDINGISSSTQEVGDITLTLSKK